MNQTPKSVKAPSLTDKIVLAFYWGLATVAVIWGDFIAALRHPEIERLSACRCSLATIACLLALAALLCLIGRLNKEKLAIPCGLILAVALAAPFIYGNVSLRPEFCMFVTSMSVSGFCFILYYEKTEQISKQALILMHSRYLEYMRSVIWVVASTLVGYLAWEIFAYPMESPPEDLIVIGFIQLAFTIASGIVLFAYSFSRKLHQIESKT